MSSIDNEESICGFNDVTLKGKDFKDDILKEFGKNKWPIKSSIKLVISLRECNLDVNNSLMVIKKSIKQLRFIHPQDCPVLIQNILLFSGKQFGVTVLQGIIRHFSVLDSKIKAKKKENAKKQKENQNMEEEEEEEITIEMNSHKISEDTLRKIEGDALWKINFTVKQNKNISSQFFKSIKENPQKHSAFFVACVFCMALDNKNQIIDYFKNTIVNYHNDLLCRSNSNWLKKKLPSNLRSISELSNSFLEAIENASDASWENILPLIIELGFLLIDQYSISSSPIQNKHLIFDKNVQKASPSSLGSILLKKTFLRCSSVQKKIFDEIFARILTSNFTQSIQMIQNYLDLLKKLILNTPHEIADKYVSKIRDLIDYLPTLPPSVAICLIEAIHPLYNYQTGLRENMILVLRKAMFSVEIDARKISIRGFLSLLSWLTERNENKNLQEEILNSLRRCLSQQIQIREELYIGLIEIYEKNLHLRKIVLQILFFHFSKYYSDNSSTPIHISLCFNKKNSNQQIEPICILLSSLLRIISIDIDNSPTEIVRLFKQLSDHFISLNLEEYEISSASSVDPQSTEGEKKINYAMILANIIGVSFLFL